MAEGWRCGGRDEGGAVELSLRLRTGDDGEGSSSAAASAAAVAQEEEAAARRRRSMTIFYNGRVCALNVTDLQARTIISMANQGNVTDQQQRQVVREDHDHHCHQADSGSASTAAQQLNPAVAAVADDRHVPPPAVAPPPRQDHLEAAASGLSMKRSLQRFLEKRKARAAAAAPLYPGERPVARR